MGNLFTHLLRWPALRLSVSIALLTTAAAEASDKIDGNADSNRGSLAPILGNYPNASTALSTQTTVQPGAAPTNATNMTVFSSVKFLGKLEGDPISGVVTVTNPHPAGSYTVTVQAFDSMGASATKTFTLIVTTPPTCTPVGFVTPNTFTTGATPFAVAVGDFNADGKQDLVTANATSGNVSIFRGDGTGNFSTATNFTAVTAPRSVAVGDFDGDGKEDVAAANFSSNNVSIFYGNRTGTFTSASNFAVGTGPWSVAVGDFNSDGRVDLAIANGTSNNVSILFGTASRTYGPAVNFPTGDGPVSVVIGDFNSDGKQDLATANSSSNDISILFGNGAGSFSSPVNFPAVNGPLAIATADFNGDGKQDLAVANYFANNVSILLGNGSGSFAAAANFPVGSFPRSVAVGDFNGDTFLDLAVSNESGTVSILLGDGAGSFGPSTDFAAGDGPYSVAVGDFNNDGKQDLAVSIINSNSLQIFVRICPLAPLSAVSRKAHGGAGTFDVPLPLSGPSGVEPRAGTGATLDQHQVIVTFPNVLSVEGVSVSSTDGGSAAATESFSGGEVTINLTGVTDQHNYVLTLRNVNNGNLTGNVIIPIGILRGDASGDRVVNAADAQQTRARSGQSTDATNFRSDVNRDGTCNAADTQLIRNSSGSFLP